MWRISDFAFQYYQFWICAHENQCWHIDAGLVCQVVFPAAAPSVTVWHFVTLRDSCWQMENGLEAAKLAAPPIWHLNGSRITEPITAHCALLSENIFISNFLCPTHREHCWSAQHSNIWSICPQLWPSGYLSSPNIRYNLPFLPSRHLTLNLKPKLLGIVSQWPGCECGNQEGDHNDLKYELTNWSVYHSLVTAGQELDTGQQTPFSDHFCVGELGRGGPPWQHLAPGGQTCPFYLPQLPWECWKNHFACQCQEFS